MTRRMVAVLTLLAGCQAVSTPSERMDEVSRIVSERAMSPQMTMPTPTRAPRSHDDATAQIRAALADFDVSHTSYWTSDDPECHDLAGLFGLDDGAAVATATTQGVLLENDGQRVRGVLDGSVAARAGVERGDVILRVNGAPFEAVASFFERDGEEARVTLRRREEEFDVTWTIAARTHRDTWLDAMVASVRMLKARNLRVGYVHAWSFAGDAYTTFLRTLLTSGHLASADALILDLRDGWGGAPPETAAFFGGHAPSLEMILRDGTRHVIEPPDTARVWQHPVALLIDERTRSGKEVLAHAFATQSLGPVIGERTAGAVVAGAPFLLDDGALLFLAVADVRVDGLRIEGVGVSPTIPVTRGDGAADPVLDAALAYLSGATAR